MEQTLIEIRDLLEEAQEVESAMLLATAAILFAVCALIGLVVILVFLRGWKGES